MALSVILGVLLLWYFNNSPESLSSAGVIALKEGNTTEAIVLLEQQALGGDVHAAETLGNIFAFGHGVPIDTTKARVWYRRAECRCVNPGQLEMDTALAFVNGWTATGEPDKTRAVEWLKLAAEAGNAKAAHLLLNSNEAEKLGFY